jgi:hypothetical protein
MIGDSEPLGYAPGVLDVLGFPRLHPFKHFQRHSGYIVTLLLQQPRRRGAVYAAAHRCRNSGTHWKISSSLVISPKL